MTELTMTAPARPVRLEPPRPRWPRRCSTCSPSASTPLYADGLADAAATGRFVLAATSLAVILLLVLSLLAIHARQAPASEGSGGPASSSR